MIIWTHMGFLLQITGRIADDEGVKNCLRLVSGRSRKAPEGPEVFGLKLAIVSGCAGGERGTELDRAGLQNLSYRQFSDNHPSSR